MLKQGLIYLILSIIIVVFSSYAGVLIDYIKTLYGYLDFWLTPIFRISDTGAMIRGTLILVLLPLILTGIPALIYRLLKKKEMPYFMEATWIIWLIIVFSNLLNH